MQNSITKAIAELERIYSTVNSVLFENKLDNKVRITIQTKGRKRKVIGFHAPKAWFDNETGERISEITLCAEDLADYNPCEILIHECVHNYNFTLGVDDCCSNGYHNKKFKNIAEIAGLVVEYDRTYGWCRTSLGEKAKAVIDSLNVNHSLFNCFRLKAQPSMTYLKKFTCDCGMIVRVARVNEFKAMCLNCHSDFTLVD